MIVSDGIGGGRWECDHHAAVFSFEHSLLLTYGSVPTGYQVRYRYFVCITGNTGIGIYLYISNGSLKKKLGKKVVYETMDVMF